MEDKKADISINQQEEQASAKRERTQARRMFNRVLKEVEELLANSSIDSEREIIESFESLKEARIELLRKHDKFALTINSDDEDNEADEYLTEPENSFKRIRKEMNDYLNLNLKTKSEQAEIVHKQKMEAEKVAAKEEVAKNVQRLKNIRAAEAASFDIELSRITNLEDEPNYLMVKEMDTQLRNSFSRLKEANFKVIEHLSETEAHDEITWISCYREKYQDGIDIITQYKTDTKPANDSQPSGISNLMKIHKISMPTFSGKIREYPKFKADFVKYIMPNMTDDDAASYILASCLSEEPREKVRNVDDDVKKMWQRLDEIYGDPSLVTDLILNEIKRMQPVEEGDNKAFIELVDTVDMGYRDLLRLNIETEISNSQTVSLIEEKLPISIKLKWSKKVKCEGSTIKNTEKFPHLLSFLLERKRIIEYAFADLRETDGESNEGWSHHIDRSKLTGNKQNNQQTSDCLIHSPAIHKTSDCRAFLAKEPNERLEVLKEKGGCFTCLKKSHISKFCPDKKKKCGIDDCEMNHHPLLHNTVAGVLSMAGSNTNNSANECILQIMSIKTATHKEDPLTVLWDSGASLSLITNRKAKELKLPGKATSLLLTKVGACTEIIPSFEYNVPLRQKNGAVTFIKAFGIEEISSKIKEVDIHQVKHLFPQSVSEIQRPTGCIDLLVGFNYAGIHPIVKESHGNLLLMTNVFGSCLGGSHPKLNVSTVNCLQHATIYQITNTSVVSLDEFINAENLGVACVPACGACKCGECGLGSKHYTIKEEKEIEMMSENLHHKVDHWETTYPWIKDPNLLEDNYLAAKAMLKSTQNRLRKNPILEKTYGEQIQDLIERKVARKLTDKEINEYSGPVHYLGHHEVMKEDSKSTPCRIVFNASAKFKGQILNEFWAKGPDLLNNQLGILLRFRERHIAIAGDIRKMYHAIKLKEGVDQHTHRFLWSGKNDKSPSTYVLTSVSFGDRPSGTIAALALQKTAEMGEQKYPKAAMTVLNNTYVDDILDSMNDTIEANEITSDISELIKPGGFEIKEWSITDAESNDQDESKQSSVTRINDNDIIQFNTNTEVPEQGKVLGMIWDKESDVFRFKVKLNFSEKKRKIRTCPNISQLEVRHISDNQLTKRQILSQINGFYDPLGLASPVILQAKIMMSQLWKIPGLDWDDTIPACDYEKWIDFFYNVFAMENIKFNRCLKPLTAIGKPICVTFSDASEEAYGAVSYVRWKLSNGDYESRLIAAKSKVKPKNKITLVRMELNGAVVASRLQEFVRQNTKYEFERAVFMVDSAIVHAMTKKESYGFKTYAAVRIGEIQTKTNPDDWYWLESQNNIADWVTRPKSPKEISENSEWQKGPAFLRKPESEWPVCRSSQSLNLPEQKLEAVVMTADVNDESLLQRFDLNRFGKLEILLGATRRILNLYKNYAKSPTNDESLQQQALNLWIKEAQQSLRIKMEDGSLVKLCPRYDNDLIVVGGRVERWNEATWNKQQFILLPATHRLSYLIAEFEHRRSGHLGLASTVAKTRSRYWIIGVRKIVKSIISNCYGCRFRLKTLACQRMSTLPEERLKPAPPFYTTGIDYFGPFKLKGEVQKRVHGKGYGVIFTCFVTRAVYLDISCDYSTDSFLQVLRRFASFRGWPRKIISDQGTQLVGASNELKAIIASIDKDKVQQFSAQKDIEWEFTTVDAPWMNGATEALVKTAKRAIEAAIGCQVLTFSQALTVFYESAELINERPIGQHPTDTEDGAYLCPNDMLLGRSTNAVPQGPFEAVRNSKTFFFIQQIVDSFWQKWTRDFFPSLVIEPKWHVAKRDVCIGDVVLIQDNNMVRGKWKLGRVSKILQSKDGKVRKVEVKYKNQSDKGHSVPFITIDRAVHNLVVIVPIEEQQ